MADYYRDVVRYRRDNGYKFKRQGRGDHEIWWASKDGPPFDDRPKAEVEDHRQRNSKGRWPAKGLLIGFRPDLAVFQPGVGLT